MSKMYELADDVRGLLYEVEDLEDPSEAMNALMGMQGELEGKIEWVGLRCRELTFDEEAAKEEAKRLAEKAKTIARQREFLKGYLQMVLERAQMKRVDGRRCNVRIQKTKAAVLLSSDLEDAIKLKRDLREYLPEPFVRVVTTTEVNKTAVLEAFQRGESIPPLVSVDDNRKAVIIW